MHIRPHMCIIDPECAHLFPNLRILPLTCANSLEYIRFPTFSSGMHLSLSITEEPHDFPRITTTYHYSISNYYELLPKNVTKKITQKKKKKIHLARIRARNFKESIKNYFESCLVCTTIKRPA